MGAKTFTFVLAAAIACGSYGFAQDWTHYGADLAATRHSPLNAITPENVGSLEVSWRYRTGASMDEGVDPAATSFQATPIALEGKLYLCTPHNVVIALDGATGRELWRYDPHTNLEGVMNRVCRGVAVDRAPDAASCPLRIFTSTLDARLIALDALMRARQTGLLRR